MRGKEKKESKQLKQGQGQRAAKPRGACALDRHNDQMRNVAKGKTLTLLIKHKTKKWNNKTPTLNEHSKTATTIPAIAMNRVRLLLLPSPFIIIIGGPIYNFLFASFCSPGFKPYQLSSRLFSMESTTSRQKKDVYAWHVRSMVNGFSGPDFEGTFLLPGISSLDCVTVYKRLIDLFCISAETVQIQRQKQGSSSNTENNLMFHMDAFIRNNSGCNGDITKFNKGKKMTWHIRKKCFKILLAYEAQTRPRVKWSQTPNICLCVQLRFHKSVGI